MFSPPKIPSLRQQPLTKDDVVVSFRRVSRHEVIVWGALAYIAAYQAAGEVRRKFNRLVNRHLPCAITYHYMNARAI